MRIAYLHAIQDSNLLRKYIYGARVDEPVCMLKIRLQTE